MNGSTSTAALVPGSLCPLDEQSVPGDQLGSTPQVREATIPEVQRRVHGRPERSQAVLIEYQSRQTAVASSERGPER